MALDLASRISEASIAVIELVPGEQRFHELARHTLRGGATRFQQVVLDSEAVRYLLPVAVPGDKLDYGCLLIQTSRCSLVWRTEAGRPHRGQIMELGPETTVAQSPVTVRGEVWGRFDLSHPGLPDMTFLVPPVASTALPAMLKRTLVEEPRCKRGAAPTTPLPRDLTDPVEPVVPAYTPQPTAAPQSSYGQSSYGQSSYGQSSYGQAPAQPVRQPEPQRSSYDLPTQAMPVVQPSPLRPAAPAAPPAPARPTTRVDAPTEALPAMDAPTQAIPMQAPPASPAPVASWAPRTADPAPTNDDLYRSETRVPPTAQPVVAPAPQVREQPRPAQPTYASAPVLPTRPDASAARPTAQSSGMSSSVRSFLISFIVTLIVGGLIVVARLVGLI